MLPTPSTTYRTEAPVDDHADLADILRTIASGLTAGMPTWTALDHGYQASHDQRMVLLHLRSIDDMTRWADWFLRCYAAASETQTTPGETYTRHSRMVYVRGQQVELFHLERVEPLPPTAARRLLAALPAGDVYERDDTPTGGDLPAGVHGEPIGGRHAAPA